MKPGLIVPKWPGVNPLVVLAQEGMRARAAAKLSRAFQLVGDGVEALARGDAVGSFDLEYAESWVDKAIERFMPVAPPPLRTVRVRKPR